MKKKITEKQPENQVYCKDCQFYIAFSNEIISIGKENEDGKDICGYTINLKRNHIGHESFTTQGDLVHCEECRCILADDRRPIYRKCKAKNRRKNCKDFVRVTKKQLLINKLKGVIISIKNMLKTFNIFKSYLLLFWLVFNVIFLIQNDILSIMGTIQIFYYCLITLVIFGVAMRK